MYKRKAQKSFFDTDHSTVNTNFRPFSRSTSNKENTAPPIANDKLPGKPVTCKESLVKLAAFQCDAQTSMPRVSSEAPPEALPASPIMATEIIHMKSSQSEARIQWKVSPPPVSILPSTQKLTINEMFDIYQASQQPSQTPTRQQRLPAREDLWAGGKHTEVPLPYLDLEISPESLKLPQMGGKANLRRTTSLPSWSADSRARKRQKLNSLGSRMRGMVEQVQVALSRGELDINRSESDETVEADIGTIPTPDEAVQEDTTISAPEAGLELCSEDWGDDIDSDLMANMAVVEPPLSHTGTKCISKCHIKAEVVPIKQRLSCDGSSDYSLELNEEDFLAATQITTGVAGAMSKQHESELLHGLDENCFSDFEDDSEMAHERNNIGLWTVMTAYMDEYSAKGGRLQRLVLEACNAHGTTIIGHLQEDWSRLVLQPGDTFRFHGRWSKRGLFTATNQSGLIILHPDVLVSATSVAGAHNCMRRSVLQDRVCATSSLSRPLLYGSILHNILQASFAKKDFSDRFIRSEIEAQILRNMEKLYLIELSIEEAKDYLYEKTGLMQRWAESFYGPGKSGEVEPMRGNGRLQQVAVGVREALDIEERFWSPAFGLKGNVDVTAELLISVDDRRSVIAAPLEFKTGKTDYQQSSYRAQVILYTLMMSERYNIDVTSGFLYYLETCQITRVPVVQNELRGLLMLRNEVASHMRAKTLPALVKNEFLCKSCYASEACFTYHKAQDDGNGHSTGLGHIFDSKLAHLNDLDIAFFNKWEGLLTKEEGEVFRYRNELWHMTSEQRERVNRCFAHLTILPGSEKHDPNPGKINQWTYKFVRKDSQANFLESQISEREPIIISDEDNRYAISCGFVSTITPRILTVTVDRPLRNSRSRLAGFDALDNQIFRGTQSQGTSNTILYRVDRDEFKNGVGIVRNNLLSLLLDPASKNASPSTGRLRELLVELKKPVFFKAATSSLEDRSLDLNINQILARDKVVSAKDYTLILGMPGTGKTTTIASIIKTLVDAGKSVLLTSYTHSAVDTIILKIAKHKMKVLRLGGTAKIHPDVVNVCTTEQHNCKTFEELDNHYNSPNVVATTCLSINHAIFRKRRFDYCIFDEASQATLPVCLGPLRFADKFVLVGDHFQLPPLVKDVEARSGGLDISLFKLLCEAHPEAVVYLQHQYRMNADIMSISNNLIYSGKLTCGSKELETRRLANLDMSKLRSTHSTGPCVCEYKTCWLRHVVDPDCRVMYLNTDYISDAHETRRNEQIVNRTESKLVAQIVEALIIAGLAPSDIGVISPYRSQLKVIQNDLRSHPKVLVDTADKYQGRDKECIVISLVRSNDSQNIGDLLKDWRRINVAFTRARSKMIIIGSQNTLANNALLNTFLHQVHTSGWAYDLPAEAASSHNFMLPSTRTLGGHPVPSSLKPMQNGRRPEEPRRVMAGPRALLSGRPILRDIMNGM